MCRRSIRRSFRSAVPAMIQEVRSWREALSSNEHANAKHELMGEDVE